MDILILGAKAAIAVTLLIAGGAKLADISGFTATMRLFLPWQLSRPVLRCSAVGIAVTELLLGAFSLSSPSARWLNPMIFALTLLFVVAALLGYALHRGRSCRCFGALSQRKFDALGILRNVTIAVLAAAAMIRVPSPTTSIDLPERTALAIEAMMLGLANFTAARSIAATRTTESRSKAR